MLSHICLLNKFQFNSDNEEDPESQHVVGELENIDDECDAHGVSFVKIDNEDEAKEYGIESFPSLVYFENSIPSVYKGNLNNTNVNLKCTVS